jgi:hypothetical protein
MRLISTNGHPLNHPKICVLCSLLMLTLNMPRFRSLCGGFKALGNLFGRYTSHSYWAPCKIMQNPVVSTYTYIHTCMHACIHTHTHIHTYIQTHIHTYIHTLHTYITYMRTYIQTDIHTYTWHYITLHHITYITHITGITYITYSTYTTSHLHSISLHFKQSYIHTCMHAYIHT